MMSPSRSARATAMSMGSSPFLASLDISSISCTSSSNVALNLTSRSAMSAGNVGRSWAGSLYIAFIAAMRSGNDFFIEEFRLEWRLPHQNKNGEPNHRHGHDEGDYEQQTRPHAQDVHGFDQAAVLLGKPGDKLGSGGQLLAQLLDLRFEGALLRFRPLADGPRGVLLRDRGPELLRALHNRRRCSKQLGPGNDFERSYPAGHVRRQAASASLPGG